MSPTLAKVLRLATIAVFAGVAFLAYRAFTPGEPEAVVEPRAGEADVATAINVAEVEPLIVRGHVFDGPGGLGLRLCQGRRNSSPPECIGPFLDLDGVNEGSFAFESGKVADGEVRWVDEALALRGTINGTRMAVSEVLR